MVDLQQGMMMNAFGGAIQAIGGRLVQGMLGSGPINRAFDYATNRKAPNVVPMPDELIRLFHCDYITDKNSLIPLLREHGIWLGDATQHGPLADLWHAIVTNHRVKLGISDIIRLYQRNDLSRDRADKRLHEQGMSDAIEREMLLGMEALPDVSTVWAALQTGLVSLRDADDMLRRLGYISQELRDLILGRLQPMNMGDITELIRRGTITRGKWNEYVSRLGYREQEDRDNLATLETFLPPSSDLIRFAIKDVFDPNKLGRREMEAELRDQQGLMESLAAGGIKPIRIPGFPTPNEMMDVPLAYWLASYDEISPTQSYEMLHRLRPNRTMRYAQRIEGVPIEQLRNAMPGSHFQPSPDGRGILVIPQAMSLYDVAKLLKEKDYNPIWRSRLTAISYRVPGRIDVRRFYKDGIYGRPLGKAGWQRNADGSYTPIGEAEKELCEIGMDQGNSPYDASQQGYWTSVDYEKTKGGTQNSRARRLLCKSYQLGAITRPVLIQRLTATGMQNLEANTYADNCDLDRKVKALATSVSAVRKAVMGGRITLIDARGLLAQQGIIQTRIDDYIRQWELELLAARKEATASQMCEWVGQGLLTVPDMEQRLKRLGWREEDIDRISRHCILGHLGRTAKEQQRLANAETRQQERRERARQAAVNRALRGRTPELLKRYFRRGVIGLAEVRATLVDMGWTVADAQRWIVTELGVPAT